MEQPSTPSLVIDKIQDLLLDTQDVEDFLNELATYSAENLSGPRGEVLCGITLLRHRTAATVASSGERARLLDELQYEYGDGPCLQCAREGVLVHIRDFTTETLWPEYAATVLNHGIRSASNTRNVKLRDVALAIVESAGGGTLKTHFS